MEGGRRLGAYAYTQVAALPPWPGGPGCVFSLVRREGDGRRCLLQLWAPRPPERMLDTLRADFLQRFSQAESMDTGPCHMGFDEDKAWILQELGGTPLPRFWGESGAAARQDLKDAILAAAEGSRAPRLLWPEVIGIKPGRILAPRILGEPGRPFEALRELLPTPEESGPPSQLPRLWEDAPDLADSSRLPIRGRAQELTYLKSLMLGLAASAPMERIVLLVGEVGLGHERLTDWAAAAAESEGLWVTNLEAHPFETAGAFLERLVQNLINGAEAELYAERPAVARALARRMATFAFLQGGRRPNALERSVEPAEVDAALAALAFAQARHPRLIIVRRLELAASDVHELVKELVEASRLPWLLSSRSQGAARLKSCTAALRNHPEAGTVVLGRLEDGHLVSILDDLLGAHDLAPALVAQLCTACLGNPGLLQRFLELAQADGALAHHEGRWSHPPDVPLKVALQEDMVQGILAGRLTRLDPAALALVRYLALADLTLSLPTLGRVLGLDPDAVEEALNNAVSAKVAQVQDHGAEVPGTVVRDLALASMVPPERARCARLLLKVLGEEGGKPFLSVRLLSFAMDPATALAQVLQALEAVGPGPEAAQRIFTECMALKPTPAQQARLWEFLSDQRCLATPGQGRSPLESALEALERAIQVLGEGAQPLAAETWQARLQGKKGQLEIRLRRFKAAAASLGEASRLMADHPFHPEQARLLLATGRLLLAQGHGGKGILALEEGLRSAGHKPEGEVLDQVPLLLELGHAQAQRALWQGALETLQSARRLLEHTGDRRRLVVTLGHLGTVYQGMGQTDSASECLKEAFALTRLLGDPELTAACNLQAGILRSCQQLTGAALTHLDSAFQGYAMLGDSAMATQAQAWKARTVATLGDPVLAELLMLQASAVDPETLTPMEKGDRVLLEGEIALFKGAWDDARRHFQAASHRFAEGGLLWRERMARIRAIQAESRGATEPAALESAWIRLERLKGPVEASGSRWLEVEWHRAHALVLSCSGTEEAVIADALLAWGEVLAGAREMRFPVHVLEASARSAQLLLDRGERLGARSRAQDAAAAFQEIWAKVPDQYAQSFLERPDIRAWQKTAASAGMPFSLPDRTDPLADWSPTQVNVPSIPPS